MLTYMEFRIINASGNVDGELLYQFTKYFLIARACN
jgi:hypothetical protein